MTSPDRTAPASARDALDSLDAPETYTRLDPEGLLGRIEALPAQMRQAWDASSALDLPPSYAKPQRVVVIGMGGSGIGGLLLRALAIASEAMVPVDVVRGYTLPGHVGPDALVFASSNSGNTEEVVAATGEAIAAGARCIAITAGGRLGEIARERRLPWLKVDWSWEPRAALGWSFASLLAVCARLGVLPDAGAQFGPALDEMRALGDEIGAKAPEASNDAKQMARRLAGTLPVIIGAEALAPVAYRWRTQINENAKQWAIADELPEMNHNAPVGYALPASAAAQLHVVMLRHQSLHPRIGLRIDATEEQMRAAGLAVEVADVAGGSVLAQMLRGVYLGDYVSYYLGLLNDAHPSPVPELDWLKARMAAS